MNVGTTDPAELERRRRLPQVRLGAVIALALAAGVAVWLVLRDDGESTSDRATPAASVAAGPDTVSLASLRSRAAQTDQPIYWAGRIRGRRFEVTETTGKFYVRYLPQGVKAGAQKPYLTVATYRHPNAFDATRAVSRRAGAVPIDVGRKGVAFFSRSQPTSVYVAYRGSPYQIEVFHPVPRIARELVSARQVRPISAAG